MARGESSDVFGAQRARRITERVIIKVLRSRSDEDLFERQLEIIQELRSSRGPNYYLRARIPEPVGFGQIGGETGAPECGPATNCHTGANRHTARCRA